ncbi:Cof-type HAD-IIB family hydrolase [Fonticella tunisiensis]|uniref:Phosphoglycolate phosphatase n=1 Tax=Fonticella tunisiensis TaxID=1096341 RepID=A0A4V6Q2T1_9CLOT|nr:Cof-type HAD-IIB family hydrolase [Fonticella tunisiensis]TDT50727.1 phosphoglycolate phosphatase [Fonticella tunisiensis]
MKYKLVAMDMDGTLLNDNKEVSERTKETLKKAADLGVKLVVCTGRIFASARIYAGIIGTKAPIIASNGAYIREKDSERIIYEKYMNPQKVRKLVEMAKKYGFKPTLFTADTVFAEEISFISANYKKWNESLPEGDRIKIEVVNNFDEVIEKNRNRLLKAVIMGDDIDGLHKLRREIRETVEVADLSIASSYSNNFEVMEYGVSKGEAVKFLANYFNISSDEVICIGDNENDISMIQYAGLGIAMGNAEDYVKNIADYVTDTNENDGVAKAIEKFVLNC